MPKPIVVHCFAPMLAALALLVATLSAQAPPQFDAASIKPSDPSAHFVRSNGGPGTKDPGLFTCENCSLSGLVSQAYDIPEYRVTALDWRQTAHFVVNAKLPAGTTKEQFHLMLQNLLAGRFKLTTHRITKELQTYDLIVANGGAKLKSSVDPVPAKEDPPDSKRPAMKPPELGSDGYPVLGDNLAAMMKGRARILYPRQTMEFFASYLSAQMGSSVIDLTGLTGKYDFSLYWAYGNESDRRAPNSDVAIASDPAPTLPEAIQSQLGLKLVQKKGPVEFLVVDHMEKTPTED